MRKAWLLALLLVAAGCDRSQDELEAALAESQRVSAEKDSLLNEVLATTTLLNNLNAELAKVEDLGVSPVTPSEGRTAAAERRTVVLNKVREVITRLEQAEASLEDAQSRLRQNERLAGQIEEYRRSIGELREAAERQQAELLAIIDTQKTQIATLTHERDTALYQTTQLTSEKAALLDTLNRVYYAVGTEDELIERGVAVKEGSKFLFFGGTRLLPARGPDPAAFTMVHRMQDSIIPLPDPEASYRIISRHSLDYVMAPRMEEGKVSGELRITDPERFWAVSPYLILVED